MQTISNFDALSCTANAVRVLMTTGYDWNAILPVYTVITLIMVVTWGATLYLFRKVVK